MITITPELKKQITEYLRDALVNEPLKQRVVAQRLGILPTYLSMIYTGDKSNRCALAAWERVYDWLKSRSPLASTQYSPIPVKNINMPSRNGKLHKEHTEENYSAAISALTNGKEPVIEEKNKLNILDYIRAFTHFAFFVNTEFIEEVWEDDIEMAHYISENLIIFQSNTDNSDAGQILRFFMTLSVDNQYKLLKYIIKHHHNKW